MLFIRKWVIVGILKTNNNCSWVWLPFNLFGIKIQRQRHENIISFCAMNEYAMERRIFVCRFPVSAEINYSLHNAHKREKYFYAKTRKTFWEITFDVWAYRRRRRNGWSVCLMIYIMSCFLSRTFLATSACAFSFHYSTFAAFDLHLFVAHTTQYTHCTCACAQADGIFLFHVCGCVCVREFA